MPRVLIPRRTGPRRKPQTVVSVNNADPLAEGLVAFWYVWPGGLVDAVTGRAATNRDAQILEDIQVSYGMAELVYWSPGSVDTGGWYYPDITSSDPWSLSGIDTASWAWRSLFDATGHNEDFGRVCDKSTAGSGENGWTIYEDLGRFRMRHSASVDEFSSNAIFSNVWGNYVLTRSGTTAGMYEDGAANELDTTVASGNFSATTADIGIGTNAPSWAVDREWEGGIAYVAMWAGRVLDAQDAYRLTWDPYALLQPYEPAIYTFGVTVNKADVTDLKAHGIPGAPQTAFAPKAAAAGGSILPQMLQHGLYTSNLGR